jgi:predicted enzyme related to lactoylglutathione lyase
VELGKLSQVDKWLEGRIRAFASLPQDLAGSAPEDFCLNCSIYMGQESVDFHLKVVGGRLVAGKGLHPGSYPRLRVSADTVEALSSGRLTVSEALRRGLIRIGGAGGRVAEYAGFIRELGAALAQVQSPGGAATGNGQGEEPVASGAVAGEASARETDSEESNEGESSEVDNPMEVLSSRILLRPTNMERSMRFYARDLGLAVYREFGVGQEKGVVFFLGGGFLELSGRSGTPAGPNVALWLQVRDVEAAYRHLVSKGVLVSRRPKLEPWGLKEMWVHDPDGVRLYIVEVPEDHPLRKRIDPPSSH